jgi:hypothetical protein
MNTVINMYGGEEIQLHAFLTSALEGCERLASSTREGIRGVYWMSPRAGLDAVENRKIISSCRESNR